MRFRSCSKRLAKLSGFATRPATFGAAAFQARFELVQCERSSGGKVGKPFVDGPHLVFSVVKSVTQDVAQDVGGVAACFASQVGEAGLICLRERGMFPHDFLHGNSYGFILPPAKPGVAGRRLGKPRRTGVAAKLTHQIDQKGSWSRALG